MPSTRSSCRPERRRVPAAGRRCWSCRCTGTWRPPAGRPRRRSTGPAARLRADRGARRCRARSRATSPCCASGACSPSTITVAPCYGGEHEAISLTGALHAAADGLGWDAVIAGPGPGILGSATRLRPRRHGGARAALTRRSPSACRRCSRPASPAAIPAPAIAGSATTPARCWSCCWPGLRVAVPAGIERSVARRCGRRRAREAELLAACGERHRTIVEPVDLEAYAGSGLPRRTMGRDLEEDRLFFAAPLAAGAALSRLVRRPARAGRTASLHRQGAGAGPGIGGSGRCREAAQARRARVPDSSRCCSTSSPTWSSSAAWPATRSRPTAPTCSSTARFSPSVTSTSTEVDDRRRLRLPRRARPRRWRSAARLGRDPEPQDGLPALLLPPPAPGRADRHRPDRRDPAAAQEQDAAEGARLLGGQATARERLRLRARRSPRPRDPRGDVRLRSAGIGDGRAGARQHRSRARLPARLRQGLEGADRAARPGGGGGAEALPARRPAGDRRDPRTSAPCSSTSAAGR